jgi:hypothetical protein
VDTLPEAERPTTLVVLDGTWHQVKALVRNNPWLDALPHVMLATPEPSRYRIRAEPQVHYLSTLEAILATLTVLEPQTQGFPALLQAFETMIDVQIERSAVRNTRRPRKRLPRAPVVPASLTAQAQHHVLLHVETVGALRTARPLHVCALRVATGERFECLIAHDPETDTRKCAKVGLTAEMFAHAGTEAQFHERWAQFLRPADVLLAWHQRALDVLGQPEGARLLKADWCNQDHRRAGHLTELLTELGVVAQPAQFLGRAAMHVGELAAIRGVLLDRARGMP